MPNPWSYLCLQYGSDGSTLQYSEFPALGVDAMLFGDSGGTSLMKPVSDFATAAQGALADTALQTQVKADWNSLSGASQILNKPSIPSAQVNSDWNAVSGVAQILNRPTLSTVATSGAYADLSGRPSLATVATTGAYGDLSGRPSLATVATTGAYTDLSGLPTIPSAQVQSDWTQATTSAPDFIKNKPTLGTAAAQNTSAFDSAGAASAAQAFAIQRANQTGTQAWSTITGAPTTLSGYGITDAYPLSGNPSSFVTNAGARTSISLTTTGSSGAATYNSTTGVLNVPAYANSGGTVTSVGLTGSDFTISGSPVTGSGSITLALANSGVTAGTYSSVTVNAKGIVTAATSSSAANTPVRTIQTVAAAANGWQISSTRNSQVNYSITIMANASGLLAGASSGYVVLEICSTNSATAANWIEIDRVTNGQQFTSILTLTSNQPVGSGLTCFLLLAGWFVRLRSVNVAGTPSFTYNSGMEVLL